MAFFIAFISVIAFYIYLNYDYLVFKHFISQHYIYTESLDKLYESQLNRDVDGKYYKYFDYIVVSSVTEKIREINNDKYTYLYTPEQYTRYKIEEKEEADASKFEIINDTTSYIK